MAKGDVTIREWGGAQTRVWQVDDRTTSSASATIKAGEPVKRTAAGSPFVVALADGDPEVGTDVFVGIAMSESTETSTVDGEVEVLEPVPGKTVLEIKATTFANVDTQAEIDALVGDTVCFDLANGVYTIDENEGDDDNVHSLLIVGGDAVRGVLYAVVKSAITPAGSAL